MPQDSSQEQSKSVLSMFPDLSRIREQSDLLGAVALVGIVVMLIVVQVRILPINYKTRGLQIFIFLREAGNNGSKTIFPLN